MLNAVAPGRAGDVTTVRDRLHGHIPESERLDLGDRATWEAATRVLREATEAAAQARAAAEQAGHAARDAQAARDSAREEGMRGARIGHASAQLKHGLELVRGAAADLQAQGVVVDAAPLSGPVQMGMARVQQLLLECASSETPPAQDHGTGAKSVITLCIAGDVAEFDASRLLQLRKVAALELADEMEPQHVKITARQAAPKMQAKIGTRRCRITVEVDQNGFAEFDSSSSESSDAGSQQSDEDRLERQVEQGVERVIRSRPTTIEVGDIEVCCILPSSVLLVLLLPTAAAHVLFQLCQQGVAALAAVGVRCCKLRGQVAMCDAALGIEEYAQKMHAAALCEAEQAAAQAASSQPVLPPAF